MMRQIVSKAVLVKRLETVLGEPVGIAGLNILLYGWTRKDLRLRVNIRHRNWLYDYEVQDFSKYAGYDLLETEV